MTVTAIDSHPDYAPAHGTRAAWRDAIKTSRLSPKARTIGQAMSDYWPKRSGAPLWCAIPTLMADTGLSRATVYRALDELRGSGFLVLFEKPRQHRAPRYLACVPANPSVRPSNDPSVDPSVDPSDEAPEVSQGDGQRSQGETPEVSTGDPNPVRHHYPNPMSSSSPPPPRPAEPTPPRPERATRGEEEARTLEHDEMRRVIKDALPRHFYRGIRRNVMDKIIRDALLNQMTPARMNLAIRAHDWESATSPGAAVEFLRDIEPLYGEPGCPDCNGHGYYNPTDGYLDSIGECECTHGSGSRLRVAGVDYEAG